MINTVGQLKKILEGIDDSKEVHVASDPDSDKDLYGEVYNINEYAGFIVIFPVDVYQGFIDLVPVIKEYTE